MSAVIWRLVLGAMPWAPAFAGVGVALHPEQPWAQVVLLYGAVGAVSGAACAVMDLAAGRLPAARRSASVRHGH